MMSESDELAEPLLSVRDLTISAGKVELVSDVSFDHNGELIEIEGTRKDRLHHYRRLTFNIQLQTMEQAFPIAYSA